MQVRTQCSGLVAGVGSLLQSGGPTWEDVGLVCCVMGIFDKAPNVCPAVSKCAWRFVAAARWLRNFGISGLSMRVLAAS